MKEIQVIHQSAIVGSIRVVNDHPTDGLFIPVDTFGRVLGQRKSKNSAQDTVVSWWISTLTPKWLTSTAAGKL